MTTRAEEDRWGSGPSILDPQRLESLRERAQKDDKPFFAISSATNEGVRELVNAMSAKLDELNAEGNRNDTVELAL